MPRPAPHELHDIPEYRACVDGLRAYYEAIPGMRDRHEMVANEVDECLSGLVQNFNDNKLNCVFALPTYETWWWRRSQHADYLRYADMMRLIGVNDPRRWLLKNPGHIEQLDLLFAIYPNAKVIQTHRDPAKAVPSLVSLLMHLHPIYEEGRGEQRAPGGEVDGCDGSWRAGARRVRAVVAAHVVVRRARRDAPHGQARVARLDRRRGRRFRPGASRAIRTNLAR